MSASDAPAKDTPDRPLSAYVGDESHSRLEIFHARAMRFPPYRWAAAVAVRLGLTGRGLVVFLPFVFLLAFFLIPFIIVLKISVAEQVIAAPPYTNLFEWVDDGISVALDIKLNLTNYVSVLTDDLYVTSYLNSAKIAAISTLLTLIVGFPIAYAMARADEGTRPMLLMAVILPFWTSFLIRIYALIGILSNEGFLNHILMWLGLIQEPLVIMNTDWAVYIGIVYSYLPFMILPLYANLEKMDLSLLEAAADLGCRPAKAFWVVTVPLAMPGIVAGCFLVFIPAVGEFVIPDIMGGSDTLMIGQTMWVEFFNNRDWPLASAVTVILLVVLVIPIVLFQRQQARAQEEGR